MNKTKQVYASDNKVVKWTEESLLDLGYNISEIYIKKYKNHYTMKKTYIKGNKPNIVTSFGAGYKSFRTIIETRVRTDGKTSDCISITKHIYYFRDIFPTGTNMYWTRRT